MDSKMCVILHVIFSYILRCRIYLLQRCFMMPLPFGDEASETAHFFVYRNFTIVYLYVVFEI